VDDARVVFRGSLQELVAKVERGEMIPKLQASHAPPCKFWTAFMVVNGIRHMAPVSGAAELRAPSPEETKAVRAACAPIISQITHCRRCRADATGLLHRDRSTELTAPCNS